MGTMQQVYDQRICYLSRLAMSVISIHLPGSADVVGLEEWRAPTDWKCDASFWDTDGVVGVGSSSGRIARQDIDSHGSLTSYNWRRCRTRVHSEKRQNGRESENLHCVRATKSTIWCWIGRLLIRLAQGNGARLKACERADRGSSAELHGFYTCASIFM